jgi:hypothetical protein
LKKVFYILITLLSGITHAQEGYQIKTFTANDGLPSSFAFTVFQDSKDFLWIGTTSGLSRFDGRNFKNYSEKDGFFGDFVLSVSEDEDHNIWVATGDNVFQQNGIRFDSINTGLYAIESLICYDKKVWVLSAACLYIIENGKTKKPDFLKLLSGQTIRGIVKTKNHAHLHTKLHLQIY